MSRYEGWSNDKLIARINDLEAQLHSTRDDASPDSTRSSLVKGTRSSPKQKKVKTDHSSSRVFEFGKYEERYVAFKFAYLGWHYNGLVTQDMPTELPTVEEEIFNALLKARLIEHPERCKFSRCGRTDKGVSAMGQVMALNVRSARVKGTSAHGEVKELPWMDQINGLLPPSIRILAYDDTISPDFDARFSCKKRHYKYLIAPQVPGSTKLDRDAMNKACSYFIGEHDFRNFCKLDASKQITNFKRTILRCEMNLLTQSPESSYMSSAALGLYVLDLEGTAFLWHQVRCITGILLLVGQGLESPEVVKELLDTTTNPTKPVYEMADDWPLTLYDCDFGDQVCWKYPEQSHHRLFESAFQTFHEARIKDAVSSFMVNATMAGLTQEVRKPGIVLGDGRVKVQSKYVSVMKRNRLADVSQSNAAWAEKKKKKKQQQEARSEP